MVPALPAPHDLRCSPRVLGGDCNPIASRLEPINSGDRDACDCLGTVWIESSVRPRGLLCMAPISYAAYRPGGLRSRGVSAFTAFLGRLRLRSVADAVGLDLRFLVSVPSCAEWLPSECADAEAAAVAARALVPAGAARVSSLSSSDWRGEGSSA